MRKRCDGGGDGSGSNCSGSSCSGSRSSCTADSASSRWVCGASFARLRSASGAGLCSAAASRLRRTSGLWSAGTDSGNGYAATCGSAEEKQRNVGSDRDRAGCGRVVLLTRHAADANTAGKRTDATGDSSNTTRRSPGRHAKSGSGARTGGGTSTGSSAGTDNGTGSGTCAGRRAGRSAGSAGWRRRQCGAGEPAVLQRPLGTEQRDC